MPKVKQYNESRDEWETYQFKTEHEATHYVASYLTMGWTAQYIYMEKEKVK